MKCAVCGDEKTLIVGWSNGNNLRVKWERDPCPACQPPPHSFHAKQKAQRIIALAALADSMPRREAGQDRGERMTDTYSTHGVICPYCGHLEQASESDGLLYDESRTEWECGECLSEFQVQAFNQWSWTTEKKQAGE